MIRRNQLAAELGALAHEHLEESAWDTQGFAEDLLSILHPHVQAERAHAWDEGYNSGKNDLRDGRPFYTRNPYRDEYDEDALTVCITHMRFIPCRIDDDTCVWTQDRPLVALVQGYQQGGHQ